LTITFKFYYSLPMNKLAADLNQVLEGSTALELLSDFGKRFFFPKGIAAQAAESKVKATKFNATIGMAYADKEPIELPSIRKYFQGLSKAETVAYAPTGGENDLRSLWKQGICKKNPGIEETGISDPVVVPGLTNGIAQIADLFVQEGDNIVVPDMFWGNYRLIFEQRNQAVLKGFPFFTEDGGLNVNGFEEAMRNSAVNSKITLIVNFPNNPTGYSPTKTEAKQLKEMITRLAEEGYKILAIMDDAYFGLFYEDDTYKQSLFSVLYNAHENILAVKIDGATKEDFVWGFRLGFVTFGCKGMTTEQYGALNKKLTGAIRSSISNCSRPAQSIIKHALQDPEHEEAKQQYFEILKKRYEKVRAILDSAPADMPLTPLPFNSGYFMAFTVPKGKAEELRIKLLDEQGIGTISIQGDYLRVAFASIDEEYLEELYSAIFEAAKALI
jgi:aspartate/methionine/tyrosine aminotransferase